MISLLTAGVSEATCVCFSCDTAASEAVVTAAVGSVGFFGLGAGLRGTSEPEPPFGLEVLSGFAASALTSPTVEFDSGFLDCQGCT